MAVYPVLVGEIAKRGIKKNVIAQCIGASPRSLRNKLAGESEFTLPQAISIRNRFFPDMSVEDLFKRSQGGGDD